MPITINEGGTLYELSTVTSNEGGVLYDLDTVTANENGTLREIYNRVVWTFPEIHDFYLESSSHTLVGTSRKYSLSGNTYTIEITGATYANFTLTAKTKITVNITDCDLFLNSGANGMGVKYHKGTYSSDDSTTGYTIAYKRIVQTGYNQYEDQIKTKGTVTLEAGDYYISSSYYHNNVAQTHTITVTFEEA